MSVSVVGFLEWKGGRNEDGDREYSVKHRVKTASVDEGPAAIMECADLPQSGDTWNFGSDADNWAFCTQYMDVQEDQNQDGSPHKFWIVEQKFSSKNDEKRCKDKQTDDPLLTAPEIDGSYSKYSEEATHDRFGRAVLSSSHEQLRGPQNEWDANRVVITIKQNVSSPFQGYILPTLFKDCLNKFPLWGLPPRCIKVVPKSFTRKFYGSCYVYYSRTLEFELRPESFDRNLLDEGSKVLHGHWNAITGAWTLDLINGQQPDPFNPAHFDKFKDRSGENCRVILNGSGLPAEVVVVKADVPSEDPFYVCIIVNTGVALSNTTYWVKYRGAKGSWRADRQYEAGDLVIRTLYNNEEVLSEDTFIAVATNKGADPVGSANWFLLPNGLRDMTRWNQLQAYEVGDMVKSFQFVPGTDNTELSGSIYVQKYDEADLLLLGIPTSF